MERKVKNFCILLHSNNISESREAFLRLPQFIKDQFINIALDILNNYKKNKKYKSDASYSAYQLLKMMKHPDTKVYRDHYPEKELIEQILFPLLEQDIKKLKKKGKFDHLITKVKRQPPKRKKVEEEEDSTEEEATTEEEEESTTEEEEDSTEEEEDSTEEEEESATDEEPPPPPPQKSRKKVERKAPLKKSLLSKRKTPPKRKGKKNFTKLGQKYEYPGHLNPLTLFYTSAYKENPKSKMAIIWLTEYGVLDGSFRIELEKRYSKI